MLLNTAFTGRFVAATSMIQLRQGEAEHVDSGPSSRATADIEVDRLRADRCPETAVSPHRTRPRNNPHQRIRSRRLPQSNPNEGTHKVANLPGATSEAVSHFNVTTRAGKLALPGTAVSQAAVPVYIWYYDVTLQSENDSTPSGVTGPYSIRHESESSNQIATSMKHNFSSRHRASSSVDGADRHQTSLPALSVHLVSPSRRAPSQIPAFGEQIPPFSPIQSP